MQQALSAIVDPRRREILEMIRQQELPAGRIAEHFEVTRPAISQHLRILKDAGLVTERRSGTQRLYRARPEGLAELREYLQGFWEGRLRLLASAAEGDQRSATGSKSEGTSHE